MPHDGPDQPDERAGAHAAGLRRVAVASVVALAVMLPLTVVSANAGHHPEQRHTVSHSTSHHRDAGPGAD